MPTTFQSFSQSYDAYYKTTRTSRGLTYRYLSVPGSPDLPTLLWMHGFPSSVYDWHYQIDFFRAKGHALIVPDMLGYGGTDKPEDPALYARSPMAKDMMDILDAENVQRVVAIAHDWGASLLSRVIDLYASRFSGFVFIAVGYLGPTPDAPYELEEVFELSKKYFGTEVTAYWGLFTKVNGHQIIEANFDSFLDMLYAEDAFKFWSATMMVRDKAEEFVSNGQRVPRAKFIADEDYAAMREHLIGAGRGISAPLNWYKASTTGNHSADDKDVVAKLGDKFPVKITQPVLFIGASQDAVCNPPLMRPPTEKLAADFTGLELNTSHWALLEQPHTVNAEIEKWLAAKVKRDSPKSGVVVSGHVDSHEVQV